MKEWLVACFHRLIPRRPAPLVRRRRLSMSLMLIKIQAMGPAVSETQRFQTMPNNGTLSSQQQ